MLKRFDLGCMVLGLPNFELLMVATSGISVNTKRTLRRAERTFYKYLLYSILCVTQKVKKRGRRDSIFFAPWLLWGAFAAKGSTGAESEETAWPRRRKKWDVP